MKNTVSDGELVTAKCVSPFYTYVFYTQKSGRLCVIPELLNEGFECHRQCS
jgi:hypothetical protein